LASSLKPLLLACKRVRHRGEPTQAIVRLARRNRRFPALTAAFIVARRLTAPFCVSSAAFFVK
jgi:hypothetical protein